MFFSAKAEVRKAMLLVEELKHEVEACKALQRKVAALEEDLHALTDKHVRLRGSFYAARRQFVELDEELQQSQKAQAPMTKAELLRKAGFTPGRPMVHRED